MSGKGAKPWLFLAGGLTGFAVAKDLMKLDFSNPEEAPEEFRAVTFNAPPAKKGMRMPSLTALEIQSQGVLTRLALSLQLRSPVLLSLHNRTVILAFTLNLTHSRSHFLQSCS